MKIDIDFTQEHMGLPLIGWLSPSGEFFQVNFGAHEAWAYERAMKAIYDAEDAGHMTAEEVDAAEDRLREGYTASRDLEEKGWLKLTYTYAKAWCWEKGTHRPPTPEQREVLAEFRAQTGERLPKWAYQ